MTSSTRTRLATLAKGAGIAAAAFLVASPETADLAQLLPQPYSGLVAGALALLAFYLRSPRDSKNP